MPFENRSTAMTATISNHLIRFVTFALIASLALVMGCGKGGNSLHVKSPAAGDRDVPLKSAYAFGVTKSFTDINNKITTAPSYQTFAANYDLDSSMFAMSMGKPLTADDQVRVEFSLVGDEGGNEKTVLKAGTYSAKADKYMKVESVGIVTRKGGADNKQWLDRSSTAGDVKITSVSGDTISGDIDVTSGDTSIKGSFTAKILKR